MLAYSYWMVPLDSTPYGKRRVLLCTLSFAVGALLGWPFSILLALPFVFEQLAVFAGDVIKEKEKLRGWRIERFGILLEAGVAAALLVVSRSQGGWEGRSR